MMLWRVFGGVAFSIFVTGTCSAGVWDDKTNQWTKESLSLTSEQLVQLEKQARGGDARAAYLLYLEMGKSRFNYSDHASAKEVGAWAKKLV